MRPIADPIFVYDDPAHELYSLGAAIWAWRGSRTSPGTDDPHNHEGRTTASSLAQCEMTSLFSCFPPLPATITGEWAWEPDKPGLSPLPLPKAPLPSADEPKRLRQLKEQARRFKAFEYFSPRKEAPIERYELRLLPQPILRYNEPESGLIDGALFFMAYGRNPEIVIAIEANREGTSTSWNYAFARIARAKLHVTLDDHTVLGGSGGHDALDPQHL